MSKGITKLYIEEITRCQECQYMWGEIECCKHPHWGRRFHLVERWDPVPDDCPLDNKTATEGDMERKILEWFFNGNVGLSSQAIAAKMVGIDGYTNHPRDPSDLRRCVEFLNAVPEAKERFEEMRLVSPNWYRLVGAWGPLTAKLAKEMKRKDRRAPETFEMIQALLER
jgi:hypothetical protein